MNKREKHNILVDLRESQEALIRAAKGFQNLDGNFKAAIKEMKETIGDLTIAIYTLETYEQD